MTNNTQASLTSNEIAGFAAEMSDLYLDWAAATRKDDIAELAAAMRALFASVAEQMGEA
jgi:hypothetical protein